jgi:hypothetical protein
MLDDGVIVPRELVSFDRDFARFSELNWSRPPSSGD